MSVFSSKDFSSHEAVIFHQDTNSGLKAIVAIHNTHLGPALGGMRMWNYANEQDAITDALRLSKGMTYKAALAGLNFGGGKSVIIGDPNRDKSEALLLAMARFIHSLDGRYQTAEDVGTTVSDMDIMRRITPYAHGISDGTGNPSPATAYGVFQGIRAASDHLFKTGTGLDGLTVGVQGLGNVGFVLCKYLVDAGAKLIVADINSERAQNAVTTFNAKAVSADDIHKQGFDIFAPCALGAGLNPQTIPELRAKIIAGAANNQLAEPADGLALKARGILYVPDYLVNAGGLIDVASEGPDYDPERVLERVADIYATATTVLRRARAENLSPEKVADRMAEERFMGDVAKAA